MNKKYIVFGSPLIGDDEISEVTEVLKSGWLGTGPRVNKFEQIFREYKGSDFSIALNSCTAALHLSMLAIGIKAGDEVIVPSMTFAATANSVIHSGGIPVLVDCNKKTMNIDPDDIVKKITHRTKAIVVVHFAGRSCEMDTILNIAKKNNLKIIEDCAHAIETKYKCKKAGILGDIGCFSFYVTKNIVTGEGGMAITNNQEYADKIRTLSLHGLTKDAWSRFSDDGYKHYSVVAPGFKYNMMDLQAGIGIHQFQRLNLWSQRRNEIWKQYNDSFRDLPVELPSPDEITNTHARHLYTLMIDEKRCGTTRDKLMQDLHKNNIGTGVHYIGLHLHPYYRDKYYYKPSDFPNSTWISDRTISIPLSPKLLDSEVSYIIRSVMNLLS